MKDIIKLYDNKLKWECFNHAKQVENTNKSYCNNANEVLEKLKLKLKL